LLGDHINWAAEQKRDVFFEIEKEERIAPRKAADDKINIARGAFITPCHRSEKSNVGELVFIRQGEDLFAMSGDQFTLRHD